VTVTGLLNTDVTDIGGWLRRGFDWWRSELVGMLPASARGWLELRSSLTAEPLPDGHFRLTRNGRIVMQDASMRRRAVTLRLPRDQVLVRETPAPPLPPADLRRMLELDIDRLTPFRAAQVFVAVGASEQDSRRAVVAAVPRDTAVQALQRALAMGLVPRAVGVADPSTSEAALDFLPRMREAHAVPRPRVSPAVVWALVAGLALANLGVAIGRDMLQVRDLRARVEAQQPRAEAARRMRRLVLAEQRRRANIDARRAAREPLRMLDALTSAVPAGAWVDRLAWDGRSVRLAGFRQDQIDVAAALRSGGRFANVRNSATEVMARQAAGQPFDVTADLAPPAAR
jgi:general secretion pathway protein L